MARMYTFRSFLPPEEVKTLLGEKIARREQTEKQEETVSVWWKGTSFMISRVAKYHYTPEDGFVRYGLVWRTGYWTGITWGARFHGCLRPGKNGGSVLEGRFRLPIELRGILVILFLLTAISLNFTPKSTELFGFSLVAGLIIAVNLLRKSWKTETQAGPQRILSLLREYFEEVEE